MRACIMPQAACNKCIPCKKRIGFSAFRIMYLFFSKDMCSFPHHVVWCIISQDGRIGSQFSIFIWYRWNLPITQHAWVVSHCCQVPLSPSCFKESESWYSMICLTVKSNKESMHALENYPKVHNSLVVMLRKMREVGQLFSTGIVQPIFRGIIESLTP